MPFHVMKEESTSSLQRTRLRSPLNSISLAVMKHGRPSFLRYLWARLGPGSPVQCFWHMFSRSFGATTFARFWQYWNPVYGYVLGFFVFASLRRFAPRSLCVVITFAFSGFLFHDLILWPSALAHSSHLPFPFVTVAFIALAFFILATERLHISLRRLSPFMRATCHFLAFAGAFAVSTAAYLVMSE
jgi:hypothetical protein